MPAFVMMEDRIQPGHPHTTATAWGASGDVPAFLMFSHMPAYRVLLLCEKR